MKLRDLVRDFVALLEQMGTDYMIVGAVAYFLYGRARATNDADFVVATTAENLEQILARLPATCQLDPQARMELFTGTMRWVVIAKGAPLKLELFLLGDDPHHCEEFARRKRVLLRSHRIFNRAIRARTTHGFARTIAASVSGRARRHSQ